jgi:hypothetical protein
MRKSPQKAFLIVIAVLLVCGALAVSPLHRLVFGG